MIKEYNFDEFEKSSKEQWLEKVNKDLGEDIARKILSWNCERELNLSAYYDQTDLIHPIKSIHSKSDWKYLQPWDLTSTGEQALDALMNGAEGLILNDAHIAKLDRVLAQVKPEYCTLALSTDSLAHYEKMTHWWEGHHSTKEKGEVLLFQKVETISDTISAHHKAFLTKSFDKGNSLGHKTIHVDCGVIQRSGGSCAVELAYLLPQSVYFINQLLDEGYEIGQIANGLFVSTSIGSSYFLELSKVRVIRMLLTQLLKQYGLSSPTVYIYASTSPLTKAAIDSNTNFLRCTSEAMSAVLGGVDYLSINPHHELGSTDRIARNISNLLKDESYFSKINDPSAGSYYLENISARLLEDSWSMFQEIESKGGYKIAIKEKFFQSEIEKDAEFQKNRVTTGRKKMVGVNDFGNQDEKISLKKLTHNYKSLAEDFEEVRRQVESYVSIKSESERPAVYLVPVGTDAKMINARYTFATNFFNWAGFEVRKIGQVNKFKPLHIMVCCGSDDDYKEDKIQSTLSGHNAFKLILVAGKEPSEPVDNISSWINAKSNRLDAVKNILTQMGITQNSSLS